MSHTRIRCEHIRRVPSNYILFSVAVLDSRRIFLIPLSTPIVLSVLFAALVFGSLAAAAARTLRLDRWQTGILTHDTKSGTKPSLFCAGTSCGGDMHIVSKLNYCESGG